MDWKSERTTKFEIRVDLWDGKRLLVKDRVNQIVIFKEVATLILRNAGENASSAGRKRQKANIATNSAIDW